MRVGKGGGGGVVHGSRELKSKIHGSRELKQTFHELLNFLLNEFFTHIVLQNWRVHHFELLHTHEMIVFHGLKY